MPAPTRRSGSRWLTMLGLVAWCLMACGGGVPAATARVAETVRPTESPDPEAGGPLAEAAVAALQADDLIAHIDQVGTLATSERPQLLMDVSGTTDLDGDDAAVHARLEAEGTIVETDTVVVGDTVYIRVGTEPWRETSRSSLSAEIDALFVSARLIDDPLSLKAVGLESIVGRRLQHLTATRPVPYVPTSGGRGQYDRFDLYVEEDGTPVFARTRFSGVNDNGVSWSGSSDFTFSKVGGPLDVVAPAP